VTEDIAGNVSAPSVTRTITVDNVAPDTTITATPPNPAAATAA
jgi:hypothetical protein